MLRRQRHIAVPLEVDRQQEVQIWLELLTAMIAAR
jgi:hypothetical protein